MTGCSRRRRRSQQAQSEQRRSNRRRLSSEKLSLSEQSVPEGNGARPPSRGREETPHGRTSLRPLVQRGGGFGYRATLGKRSKVGQQTGRRRGRRRPDAARLAGASDHGLRVRRDPREHELDEAVERRVVERRARWQLVPHSDAVAAAGSRRVLRDKDGVPTPRRLPTVVDAEDADARAKHLARMTMQVFLRERGQDLPLARAQVEARAKLGAFPRPSHRIFFASHTLSLARTCTGSLRRIFQTAGNKSTPFLRIRDSRLILGGLSQSMFHGYVLTFKQAVPLQIQREFPLVLPFAPHEKATGRDYILKSRSTHYSHLRMLLSCMEKNFSPCVVFEEDVDVLGNASSLLSRALHERPSENLILIGTNLVNKDVFDLREHTAMVNGTGGGCHGYVVRDPQKLLLELLTRRKPKRANWHEVCVENLHHRVAISRESLVWQRNKISIHAYRVVNGTHGTVRVKFPYKKRPIRTFPRSAQTRDLVAT